MYSLASKFVLDNNLHWGDKVTSFPENVEISGILFSNPEIFIDKRPRPGYRIYTFKDKSSISISVNGINNGIHKAYTMKRVLPTELEKISKETEYYDHLYKQRKNKEM